MRKPNKVGGVGHFQFISPGQFLFFFTCFHIFDLENCRFLFFLFFFFLKKFKNIKAELPIRPRNGSKHSTPNFGQKKKLFWVVTWQSRYFGWWTQNGFGSDGRHTLGAFMTVGSFYHFPFDKEKWKIMDTVAIVEKFIKIVKKWPNHLK